VNSALVVYSGGKPFAFEDRFAAAGFGLRSVASHRVELTSSTFPFGRPVDRTLFTSRNAVRAIGRGGANFLRGSRIHAVGAATREALAEEGLAAEPAEFAASAAGLLRALPERLDGEFLFWPRGSDADPALAEELRARGADVLAPVVYRKEALALPAELPEEIRGGGFGAFAATSPRAADWLFENLDRPERERIAALPAAVLGEATARTLRARGCPRVEPSREATFQGLADRLLALLSERR
jgi:uroporphyrinogen-III synthase